MRAVRTHAGTTRRRKLRPRAVLASCVVVFWGSSWVLLRAAPLKAQPAALYQRAHGFGPDAQLTGGGGFGFEGALDNAFLARARVGALYARAPWIANLGLTVDVGALARMGLGGEFELSQVDGLFGSAGVARVRGSRWLVHAGVGFRIFGLEWQHVFGGSTPHNALLFEVRLPLGLWWLHKREERAQEPHTGVVRRGQAPPSAVTRSANVIEATERERTERLADARRARERGDYLAESVALSRVYALRPEPGVALQLAAAELALGKPKSALLDLRRVGDVEALPAAEHARADALKRQIDAALAQLRLRFEGVLTEQDVVQIDGRAEPGATLDYDVLLDPGEHLLQVTRAGRTLVERRFTVQAAELLRLTLELPSVHSQ